MTEDHSWKTPQFRQSVVNKINEAILASGMNSSKNSMEMENHVFQKARNKDEYLGYVARLILHVREINSKKNPQNQVQQNDPNNQAGQGGGGGMPDPINALQNLASQGTRPPMMGGNMPPAGVGNQMVGNQQGNASTLLQNLTQRPQMQPNMQQMQNMPPNHRVGIRPGLDQMTGPNQMGGMMPNQMQPGQNMQGVPMQNTMSGGKMQINMGPGNQMPGQNPQMQQMNQMNQNQMQGMPPMGQQNPNQMAQMGQPQMGQQQMGMVPNQQINQMGMVRQQLPPGMQPNQQMTMGQMNPNVPQQMGQQVQQGPNVMQSMNQQQQQIQQPNPNQMAGGPNQMAAGGPGQMNQMMNMAGMQRKPQEMMGNVFTGVRSVTPNTFLRQSPSPSVPSPAAGGPMSGQPHSNQMSPMHQVIPSPSPQMGSVPPRNIGQSPGSSLNTPGQPSNAAPSPLNPQEEQLYREKYRSLTKYIEPLKKMIARMENDDGEKILKMKRLLEILCNPTVRIPLETLYKCETALTNQLGTFKEHPTNNPLLEAVRSTLESPIGNHTLYRTFRPCLEFGADIKNMPPPIKRKRLSVDETSGEIPHVLQGEIARLDHKFKVSLDPSAQSGTKTIKLMCWLDDKNLPCVPPVAVTIPEDYPFSSPSCCLTENEYNATPFLVSVQKSLLSRVAKLPKMFSLSHLLDTWEISVRQACSPNKKFIEPTTTTVLLGV